jgi:signal transduction histidine kinase
MSDRREQANLIAELSELSGGLAHEIRNPLSTLKVNLQLLAEDIEDAGNNDYIDADLQRRALQRLHTLRSEAERLEQLLNSFLHLVSQQDIETRPADLNILVQQLIEFYRPTAEQHGIQIRTSLANEPLVCSVDGSRFKQALLNLFINAQQAMPEGGELIITTSVEGSFARIEITDTGIGIPADSVPKVFSPFYSTKKEGSGLGLSLTKRILDEHAGTIELASDVGKGTRFSIRLRLAPAA